MLQSFTISVAMNNFESKCPVLNADVRVLLLSIHCNRTVIARADNFVSSRISFVFGCGLSASAGNLLKFFSCYCNK